MIIFYKYMNGYNLQVPFINDYMFFESIKKAVLKIEEEVRSIEEVRCFTSNKGDTSMRMLENVILPNEKI